MATADISLNQCLSLLIEHASEIAGPHDIVPVLQRNNIDPIVIDRVLSLSLSEVLERITLRNVIDLADKMNKLRS